MAQLQAAISNLNSNGTLSSTLVAAGLGPLIDLQTSIYYHSDDSQPSPQDEPLVPPI